MAWSRRWTAGTWVGFALVGSFTATPGVAQNRAASIGGVPSHSGALVLDRVTVIDVEHGRRLRDQRVVIVGNRIRALGSPAVVHLPPGARRIDARGRYLIPGLWDMHFHAATQGSVTAASTLHQVNAVYRQLVASGITGIRDPGSAIPLDTLQAWKHAIATGARVGPRLIVTGPSIEGATGECTREHAPQPPCQPVHVYISRPDEAPALVDSLKAAGADMIKIHNVPRPIWFALAAAARAAHIPFGGHVSRGSTASQVPTADGLAASDSGAMILDHELYMDACGRNDTVQSLVRCDAVAAQLRRNHTWLVGGIGGAQLPDSLEQRALRYGDAEAGYGTGKAWRPPTAMERSKLPTSADFAAAVPESVRHGQGCRRALLAHAVDLPWMPGPDFGNFGIAVTQTHLTLLAPVLCGVPSLWVLQAATLNPARALGATDSLGTVAVGKVADLVLLDGDPLEDIWNVTKITAVVANGRYFDRPALDQLLAEAGDEWARAGASPTP